MSAGLFVLSVMMATNKFAPSSLYIAKKHQENTPYRVNSNQFTFDPDFHGLTISAAVFGSPPAVRHIQSKNNSDVFSGYYPDICQILVESMNLTLNLTWYEDTAGTVLDGKWTGVLGRLQRGEFDMLVGDLTISEERLNIADFAHTLLTSRYQVYMRPLGYKLDWLAPMKPLSLQVWLTILLWIGLGTLATIICGRLHNLHQTLCERFWNDLNLSKAFFILMQSLCQQGCEDMPKRWSFRLILITSFLTSSVLLPSYSAFLVSSLTRQTPERLFTTLEEMMSADCTLIIPNATSSINFFLESAHPLYQAIVRDRLQLRGRTNYSVAPYYNTLGEICHNDNVAAVADENALDTEYALGLWENCNIVKMDELLTNTHLSIAFKKGSSYLHAFNVRSLQIREVGILNRMNKKYWSKTSTPRNEFKAVGLTGVAFNFFVVIAGLIFSLIILTIECVLHYLF